MKLKVKSIADTTKTENIPKPLAQPPNAKLRVKTKLSIKVISDFLMGTELSEEEEEEKTNSESLKSA